MKTFLAVLLIATSLHGSSLFSSDIEKVFKEAKAQKKPILIDFFGIWCPPCNELDETVFDTPAFIQKAKAFKLLKVDADKKESWKIKSRYKVGGYPTVVFTDPSGEEIYRFVGYRTLREVLRLMDLVLKSKNQSFESACKSKNVDDLWRCAIIHLERDEKKEALSVFKLLEPNLKKGTAKYLTARGFQVEHSETEDLKKLGFEQLIQEYPGSVLAPLWTLAYMDLFSDKSAQKPKADIIEKALSQFEVARKDPDSEELGMILTDLLQMKAEILSRIGKEGDAKGAWQEAAALFEKEAAQLPKGSAARGFTIERVGCLEGAGETQKALALANEYREKFPEEFTFHYQAAGLLNRMKKYNEAIPVAQKAYSVSYGDNKIRSATLLIQLLQTVSDKNQAKKIYEEVTADVKPEKELKVRTHRYLVKLTETYQAAFGK